MAHTNGFQGCKVFIHASNSDTILADTIVTEYDSDRMTITILGNPHFLKEDNKISMLILQKKALYEFLGTVRKVDFSGNREIALFKGRVKEDRHATRYAINAPGQIDKLIVGGKAIPLSTPIDALIVNISTDGILVQIQTNFLNIGTVFQISMNANGSMTQLKTCVKRIRQISQSQFEYGCTLISKA